MSTLNSSGTVMRIVELMHRPPLTLVRQLREPHLNVIVPRAVRIKANQWSD